MGVARALSACLVAAALASGCASKPKSIPARPAEDLYAKAEAQIKKKRWDRAAEEFQRLVDTHPYHPLTPHAELRLADMYFLDGRYPEALAAYEQFLKMHPTNEWAPYTMYLLASCHYHQRTTYDRDPTATRKAAEIFERLVSSHPDSRYAELARTRLGQVRAELAEHELYIGAFYLKQKRYEAALRRFEKVIRLYPEQPASERARLKAGQCQLKLSRRDDARQTLSRLIHAAPGSSLAARAVTVLREAGLTPLPAAAKAPAPSGAQLNGHSATR
jgi:outer membrane protein assembly factor BamD